ncbi:MAG: ABC transporter ATP-binding protein [Bradyrhizobium sp.]|uniref:ABC transporter ATP-binding protein n=1 Tax=Bradyrhizobium sp. TaxID=376 RepID=UPI001DC27F89|nr:ABC transporter ATP-binding protein [Bradyrhizobium sp.]MBV9561293.1 ABC transporter ATP-binding protein [Bradyrhizobium sp.]
MFQSYAIWPHMSVFENVAFPLRVARDEKFTAGEIGRLVDEALARVSLQGFGSRSATRPSGGQQQRVALARAIVRKPRLLQLDEPLSNLDAALREEMRNELRRLRQEIGVITVYVTYDQAEALEMSDRIAVRSHGRIVQMGAPQDIYFRPANRFVADFVGTTNWLIGRLGESRPEGLCEVKSAAAAASPVWQRPRRPPTPVSRSGQKTSLCRRWRRRVHPTPTGSKATSYSPASSAR